MKNRKLEYPISVKCGKVTIKPRLLFDQDMKDLPDGDYLLTVKKAGKHSREQENFRWGVLYPEILAGLVEMGWEVKNRDQVHEIVRELFLKTHLEHEGKTIEFSESTSNLTASEESELQDNMRAWAKDFLGITLSYPNESESI